MTQISQTIGGGEKAFDLTYDSLGRKTAFETPLYRSKGKWQYLSTDYTYDAAGRLTNIAHSNPAGTIDTLTYGYDPNGNRISLTGAGAQPQRAEVTDTLYDEANEVLQFNADSMAYDENGNLLSRTDACGTTSYEWDARDRLVGITGYKPDCSPLATSFAYDPMGRRVEKTINGVTTMYLYDGLDIIMEMDEMGAPTASYIRTLSIDEPLGRIDLATGTPRFYLQDALGSVTALTDENGVVKTTYGYNPFGHVAITGEVSGSPFQYTGRENDGTGFYYYRARYYSPELQRFISEDPIGLDGGINFYNYAGNNPVNFADPWGLWTFQLGAGGIGGAGAGAKAHSGIAISYSNGVFQIGTYETQGVGAFGGYGGSLAIEFAVSKNKSIQDLSGMTVDTGIAIGEGGGVGIEANVPINSAASASYGGSIGITAKGIPVEEHSFISHNWVQTLVQIDFSNKCEK
jgi:RHS repeat-associated protein